MGTIATTEVDDEAFMRRAIMQARIAQDTPGAKPIGCVIVVDGKVVAEGFNHVEIFNDPTAHAEIFTMRRLGEKLGTTDFRGATLYTTLEPCGMCTMACIWAKISRVVFGAGRGDVHSMYFEDRHMHSIDFIKDAYRDDIVLVGGILKAECATLYTGPNEDVPKSEQFNR